MARGTLGHPVTSARDSEDSAFVVSTAACNNFQSQQRRYERLRHPPSDPLEKKPADPCSNPLVREQTGQKGTQHRQRSHGGGHPERRRCGPSKTRTEPTTATGLDNRLGLSWATTTRPGPPPGAARPQAQDALGRTDRTSGQCIRNCA